MRITVSKRVPVQTWGPAHNIDSSHFHRNVHMCTEQKAKITGWGLVSVSRQEVNSLKVT